MVVFPLPSQSDSVGGGGGGLAYKPDGDTWSERPGDPSAFETVPGFLATPRGCETVCFEMDLVDDLMN